MGAVITGYNHISSGKTAQTDKSGVLAIFAMIVLEDILLYLSLIRFGS